MSDQVTAEIERMVADLDDRLAALGRPEFVTSTMAYSVSLGWFCNGHFKEVRGRSENPLTALSQMERMVRELENNNNALARTLGLEAAE